MKKCYFIHSGTEVAVMAKGGRKWKRQRNRQSEQSYILASSTYKSMHKPVDLQITAENYEGEDLDYNIAY